MSNKAKKDQSEAVVTVTTVMAFFGCVALIWLLAVKWFPGIAPGFTPHQPSQGVVILDAVGYLQTTLGLSESEKANVWMGVSGLAEHLSSQGYIVIQPSEVIHAPTSAYVPERLIDQWVSAAVDNTPGETQPADEEGDKS
jgi:hypothetical protein